MAILTNDPAELDNPPMLGDPLMMSGGGVDSASAPPSVSVAASPSSPAPMKPMGGGGGTADLESHLAGTGDLESHAGPRMNPMLQQQEAEPEAPSPQGPPPDGKQRFHNTMADFEHRMEANRATMIGLDPSDPDYTKKLAGLQAQHGALATEKARYEMLHPWGGPESAHPGVLGKIGHVAGEIGNVVGNATLGKENMSAIPGSEAGFEHSARQGEGEIARGIGDQQKVAQTEEAEARVPATEAITEHTKAETADLQNKPAPAGPSLTQQYDDAIHADQAQGIDPAKDPKVQQLADAQTSLQKQPADKNPPHITALGPDGKSHIMERDPATGAYSVDRGIAPPNFAQVAPGLTDQKQLTNTKELVGTDGIAHIMGYNPQTKEFDRDMGVAGTGQQGSRLFASGISRQAGELLIHDITANKERLGTLSAWVQKYGLDTPIADPPLARLQAELSSFAALQPAQHGFRSHSAMETFQNVIGGLQKNPDATIESIRGITSTTSTGLPQAGAPGTERRGGAPTIGSGGGASNALPATGGGRPSFAQWRESQKAANATH